MNKVKKYYIYRFLMSVDNSYQFEEVYHTSVLLNVINLINSLGYEVDERDEFIYMLNYFGSVSFFPYIIVKGELIENEKLGLSIYKVD